VVIPEDDADLNSTREFALTNVRTSLFEALSVFNSEGLNLSILMFYPCWPAAINLDTVRSPTSVALALLANGNLSIVLEGPGVPPEV
jgi:hypothetical protein